MFIGAHTSTAGGAEKAVERGLEIGAECVQIFASSPRTWAAKPIADANADRFRELTAEHKMGPAAIHGKYLLALGSPLPENVAKSVTALIADMEAAQKLDALGVVFHPASHRGQGFEKVLPQFTAAVKRILAEAQSEKLLMLETSAGSGDHIGSKFAELGAIIREVKDERLTVCLDTQHVWAAGYDISTPESLAKVLEEFDREIGLSKLTAIHANDSKKPLGSAVDRHENIGLGEIGETAFAALMAHPAASDLPIYLEVPGMAKEGPDKPNVDTLKRLRAAL